MQNRHNAKCKKGLDLFLAGVNKTSVLCKTRTERVHANRVNTFGTAKIPEEKISDLIAREFDLTPDGRSLDDMVRAAADRYLSQRMGVGERLG